MTSIMSEAIGKRSINEPAASISIILIHYTIVPVSHDPHLVGVAHQQFTVIDLLPIYP